ncbi:MATE family efflux transporter [candidate division KSB3 bacterium]|uniref:MATE family efflux transporter n=1 Tax=candidate division KSB3 bacterium TaxID=2044937 RepID=A0A2G6E197_9BACT|nr:MAG: MATE family efflux transporter [candidate division KSB3 bacterium]PIE28406.1 MAG: MATE family efflux transporter [candidate division KSB3 bacterium]
MQTELRQFYVTLFSLALPIIVQNVITSSLHLVDTAMIGQIGEIEVAAVGLANRYVFILILVFFAISNGTSILTAQYWGKKTTESIGVMMAIAVLPCLGLSLLFFAGALFFPEAILAVFTKDAFVIETGSLYLRPVAWSYIFTAVTMLYALVLRSMEAVKLPMYAAIIALSLNTLLNYCLILGHFGFPALEVRGAAIATLIARIVEAVIILTGCYWKKYPVVSFSDFLRINSTLIRQFFKTAFPVLVNELSWVLGMTMYTVVFARMGTAEIAAMNIVGPVEGLSVGAFLGMANAGATMIGNQIGAGRDGRASRYAARFSVLSPLGAVGMGLVIAFCAPTIVSYFKVSREVREMALNTLFVLSAVLWVKMFNLMCIVGILRAGGDTTFSMLLEMIVIWLVGVPLAFLGGLYWKMPVHWVFALVCVEEVLKMLAGMMRMMSKKWIHDLTNMLPVPLPEEQERIPASW